MLPLELLGAPEGSCLVRACLDVEQLTVHLAITAPTAACPVCGSDARRVRSRYTRRLDDLPCLGRRVRLRVAVRRFVCPRSSARDASSPSASRGSPRRGQGPPTGSARPRRTSARRWVARPAHASLHAWGWPPAPTHCCGGSSGSRTSRQGPLAVVGIDDWAWRKGQRYGTIVVDLERSDVIDLLPDRDADTVAAWLKAHPGVEVVSRDRSAAYAQAATEGASQAGQVADRWHLLKNLREAVERVLERHSAAINAALKALEAPPGPDRDRQPLRPTQRYRLPNRPHLDRRSSRTRSRHDSRPSGRDGGSWSSGLSGSTNSTSKATRPPGSPGSWACRGGPCSGTCGARRAPPGTSGGRADRGWTGTGSGSTPGSPRASSNVAELHRQLTERGLQGSYGSVYAFVAKRLGAAGKKRERLNAADAAGPGTAVGEAALLRVGPSGGEAEAPRTGAARRHPRLGDELAAALDLADGFADLIRKRSAGTLSGWLTRGEASSDPDLRRFAEGIRRDEAAVQAAVTETWSNGPVEGHVNRLKTIKRQMYGRAGFALLRAGTHGRLTERGGAKPSGLVRPPSPNSDTAGEFVSGVCKPRISSAAHLAQLPAR